MVNAKADVAPAPSQAQIDFDKLLKDKTYTDSAKELGKSILKKLTSIGADTKIEELNGRIAKAAGENDVPLMKTLFAELNKLEQDQKNLKDQHKTIRGNNKFETVVQAWSLEIRELALSIAVEAIKSASAAQHKVNAGGDKGSTGKKGKGETRPVITYNITNDKKETTTLVSRPGRAASNLKQDAETFAFLGFKIEAGADGKEALKPATIKLSNGTEIPATRPNIVRAIAEKTAFEGFTVSEIK